jgi:hypothetical protein
MLIAVSLFFCAASCCYCVQPHHYALADSRIPEQADEL